MYSSFYRKFVGVLITGITLFFMYASTYAEELMVFGVKNQNQHSNFSLTPKEKDWLANHKKIKVAVKSGWMPIEFRLENEVHRGLSIDYLSRIENLTLIDFEIIEYTEDIDPSQADVISSVSGVSIKNSSFKILKHPYLVIPNAIYINKNLGSQFKDKNLADFNHAIVAVYRNSPIATKLRERFPNIKLLYVDVVDEAFDNLKNGKIDAYIGNELVIDYHIGFHRLDFVEKSGVTPFNSNVSMAVRSDEPELSSILEKALLAIGQNNAELTDEWVYKTKNQEPLLKSALTVIFIIFSILSFRFFLLKRKAKLQLAENQEKIWHQANFDYLTNLPNRHLLQDRLEKAILRADRLNSKVGLIFIDLDDFKNVNDLSGHSMGDKLLQQAAIRISNCVREEDTTARLGGDEFMVVISDFTDTFDLEKICQKILSSLQLTYEVDKNIFFITASIGVTIYPNDSRNTEELLKYADQAMYEAKKLGKNLYQFFTKSMQLAITNRVSIINDLRMALKDNQFELYYQPIIRMSDSEILKAEALIRWKHPKNGLVGPNEFISLAEESGLIIELGNWIFNQAISDLVLINTKLKSDFQLSINVSPHQFSQPKNLIHLVELLHQKKINGETICLEITEGLLLEPSSVVINTIDLLTKAGIKFAIDDFGTGYSALAYLKKFNITYVKIDKSFIQNLKPDNYDTILCGSIIQMAHKLDIELIAEGVEDKKQQEILGEFGCDYIQGYLYGKPQPLNELLALIESKANH